MKKCAIVYKGREPKLTNQIIGQLTRKISPIIKRPRYEVSSELRNSRGILLNGVAEDITDEIVQIFCIQQIPVEVIDCSRLYSLASSTLILDALIDKDFFEIILPHYDQVYWDDIILLACGVIWQKPFQTSFIEKQEFHTMSLLKDDIKAKEQLKDSLWQEQENHLVEFPDPNETKNNLPYIFFDIITIDFPRRFRISRRDFQYKLLETTIAPSSKQNFYQVVKLIVERAKKSFLTHTTEMFLENIGEISEPMLFDNEKTFENYLQWNCLGVM